MPGDSDADLFVAIFLDRLLEGAFRYTMSYAMGVGGGDINELIIRR